MQVSNRKFGGFQSEAPSIDEINARVADARRAQSRAIVDLVSTYVGALERRVRSRPRFVD